MKFGRQLSEVLPLELVGQTQTVEQTDVFIELLDRV